MPFAPEDKRAWENSEIMAEFEKVAAESHLLDGGPSEAFEPLPEKEASPSGEWEEDGSEAPSAPAVRSPALEAFERRQAALPTMLMRLARSLADKGNIKGAYRAERAAAEIRAAIEAPAEGGE